MSNKYDDILYMKHHVSEKHPQMSMEALEDEVKETARLNDERIEMGEEVKVTLDRKITNGDVD